MVHLYTFGSVCKFYDIHLQRMRKKIHQEHERVIVRETSITTINGSVLNDLIRLMALVYKLLGPSPCLTVSLWKCR